MLLNLFLPRLHKFLCVDHIYLGGWTIVRDLCNRDIQSRKQNLRSFSGCDPSAAHRILIWHIMGTFFVIIFAIIGTKLVRNLRSRYGFSVRESRKYNPEVIKYRPYVSKYTPYASSRRRGGCLFIKGLYLIAAGQYCVKKEIPPQSSNFVPLSYQLLSSI